MICGLGKIVAVNKNVEIKAVCQQTVSCQLSGKMLI